MVQNCSETEEVRLVACLSMDHWYDLQSTPTSFASGQVDCFDECVLMQDCGRVLVRVKAVKELQAAAFHHGLVELRLFTVIDARLRVRAQTHWPGVWYDVDCRILEMKRMEVWLSD